MTAGVAPKQSTPGGDFGWLKKAYTFSDHGTVVEDGSTHGHNIVAADKGYTAVTGNSPGGSYPASKLGCNEACEDSGTTGRATTVSRRSPIYPSIY